MKNSVGRKDVVVYSGSGNLRIEVLADANTIKRVIGAFRRFTIPIID